MIRNEKQIEAVIEQINDLTYDIMLLESELKGCEIQSAYELAFNELLVKKTELAVLKDINGVA